MVLQLAADLLARLFQERGQSRLIRFDESAVPGTGPGELDYAPTRRFLREDAAEGRDACEAAARKLSLITEADGAARLTLRGRCVAGREWNGTEAGGWIRPVSARDGGEVSEYERQYEDGSDPRVFDVIDVPVLESRPKDCQTELHADAMLRLLAMHGMEDTIEDHRLFPRSRAQRIADALTQQAHRFAHRKETLADDSAPQDRRNGELQTSGMTQRSPARQSESRGRGRRRRFPAPACSWRL